MIYIYIYIYDSLLKEVETGVQHVSYAVRSQHTRHHQNLFERGVSTSSIQLQLTHKG
jgi:hypothetical protein